MGAVNVILGVVTLG